MKSLYLYFMVFLNTSFTLSQNVLWQQTGGPQGGSISSICFHSNTVFAGGIGGVFRSSNGGGHWSYSGLAHTRVNKLVTCENILFAGTESHGIFISSDLGISWTELNNGLTYHGIADLAVKDTFVFAATKSYGVFRINIHGDSWQSMSTGIDNEDMRTIIVCNSAIITSAAGASGSGMFRSTDNGETWTRLDPYPYAWMADAICRSGDTLFAARFSNRAQVYLSTDDGLTWYLPEGASAPSDIIISLYADHTGLYAGIDHRGLYRSINCGVSWSYLNKGLSIQSPYCIAGNGQSVFIGSHDGIHKTTNAGDVWYTKNNSLANGIVTCISSIGEYIYAGTYGTGLFRCPIHGGTWTEVNPSYVKIMYPFLTDIISVEGLLFILAHSSGGFNGKVMMSSDQGAMWFDRNSGIDAYVLNSMTAADGVLYVSTDYGLFKSTNYGSSWSRIINGLPNNGRPNVASVASIGSAVIAANGESGIYRSTDKGENWTKVSVPSGVTPPIIKVAAVGTTMFAGCSQISILFQSSDMGATWQRIPVPLYSGNVKGIAGNQGEIYIAVSGAGIITNSGGSTWKLMNTGLPHNGIESIHFAGERFWAGSWGSGVFRSIDSSEIGMPFQMAYSIEQNYPNPFNSATTIQFNIPYDSKVKLIVYNILGQRVATLADEYFTQGNYEITWNAIGLTSGVYFYRLEADRGYSRTLKTLFLK